MAVPDTTTFTLQDVVDEVNPTTNDLQTCFIDSNAAWFDSNYSGDKNSLYNFRNYNASIPVILEYTIVEPNTTIFSPNMEGDILIDYGDGSSLTNGQSHTYVDAGIYTSYIYGAATTINTSESHLTKVISLGNNDYVYMRFQYCVNLTSFDTTNIGGVGDSLASLNSLFSDCTKLQSVNLSGLDTRNVTDMSYVFYNCTMLSSIVLQINTTSAVTMQSMFRSCNSIVTLDLTEFNTTNVTNMNYMFGRCSNLSSLEISSFDTRNVTNMGFMFVEDSKLTYLNVSNFDTANVTDMQYMFATLSSIVSLDTSSFDMGKVVTVNRMFLNGTLIENNADEWWNTASHIADTEACFFLNTSRPNFSSIPNEWK